MRGIFVFDDLHAEVNVRLRGHAVPVKVGLHIAMTCHRLDPCAQQSDADPVNGVVITPEQRDGGNIPFLVFATSLDFPGIPVSMLEVDVQEREVLWRSADADLVALAINDSLASWDGQNLATLRDEMALGGISRWLDRLADAAGIHAFRRFSGEPVEYQHYLI